MQVKTDVRVVLMTAPDADVARELVRRLVDERLAACGNIVGGLLSVYRWEGEVHEDPEVLVILKTHASVLDELLRRALELHPYDVPEALALPVMEGFPPYLDWVAEECGAVGR